MKRYSRAEFFRMKRCLRSRAPCGAPAYSAPPGACCLPALFTRLARSATVFALPATRQLYGAVMPAFCRAARLVTVVCSFSRRCPYLPHGATARHACHAFAALPSSRMRDRGKREMKWRLFSGACRKVAGGGGEAGRWAEGGAEVGEAYSAIEKIEVMSMVTQRT